MPVSSKHREYTANQAIWRRNRAAVAGQDAIKAGRTLYLPQPNASDTSDANKARYERYLERALWYAAPERTKNSLIGSVFRKGPERKELPPQIEYLLEDADGAGISLEQVGKEIIGEQLEVGRVGVLVDYPPTAPGATAEDTANRRAHLSIYPAETLINWRFEGQGAGRKLTLVVLAEEYVTADDGYLQETTVQYRVLRLEGGRYVQRVYQDGGGQLGPDITPTDSAGNRWREIPFVIIGSENNRPDVDRAPLTHLCNHAIAYWQTSADHRENLYTHGQLTLGISTSLDNDEWTKANPGGVLIGAPYGVFLGEGGAFHTASAPESSSLSKALEDLRLEMAELGAQIIQKGSNAQTAEAARIDATAEASVLSNVVGNASEGIEQALEWACAFMGGDPARVEFALNREFFDTSIDPQQRVAMMAEWQSGILAKSDVRRALRKADVIDAARTDEDIDAELAAETPRVNSEPLDLGEDA